MRNFAALAALILGSMHANAQMANSSLFADVKSVNPAVIGQRVGERITLQVAHDKVTREQNLDPSVGATVTGKAVTDIQINSGRLFRGGKGGGNFTSEFAADYVMGKKIDKLSSDVESQSIETEAKNGLAYMGFGFGKNFGISGAFAQYENESRYAGTFTGQAFSGDMKVNGGIL